MSADTSNDFRRAVRVARLIERVERLDPEAAQWLRDGQFEVFSAHYSNHSVHLSNWFSWVLAPQGYDFWKGINVVVQPPPKAVGCNVVLGDGGSPCANG